MANVTGSLRVESFPFDSKADGYDADGYPVYDRAVGALTLRTVFRQFFTDGVFGTPADALQISKGDGGLRVNVAPGVFIIRGAMGRVGDGDEPVTLTLSDTPPQGNVAYGIMLRYDENDTASIGRSLSIVAVAGEASSSAYPPAPDQSTPGIFEYRLGYVTVPSGMTDLSGATVTNEKGLAVCPYAAPFDNIDLSEIVADARAQAQETTEAFLHYAQQYYDLVASALDGTTAGELQEQIDAITPAGLVDNVTLVQSSAGKMQVKTGGIGTAQLADGAVTQAKLGDDVASFIQNVVKPQPGKDIGAYTWQELIEMANDQGIELSDLDYLIGQSRNISITGYGTFAFQLIGIGHDSLASGGTSKLLTFQSIDIVCNHNMNSSNTTSGGWASSAMRTFMNGELLSKFPQYVQDVIVEVKKPYCATANGSTQYSNDKLFIASEKEIFGTSSYGNDGTQYEYWSINNTNNARIKKLNGSAQFWWMRSVGDSARFRIVNTDGSADYGNASYATGCVPCFCIGKE